MKIFVLPGDTQDITALRKMVRVNISQIISRTVKRTVTYFKIEEEETSTETHLTLKLNSKNKRSNVPLQELIKQLL